VKHLENSRVKKITSSSNKEEINKNILEWD